MNRLEERVADQRERAISAAYEELTDQLGMDDCPTIDDFKRALAALEPQGLKIVPVEPTEAMQKAGYELMGGGSAFVYRAMLNAVEG